MLNRRFFLRRHGYNQRQGGAIVWMALNRFDRADAGNYDRNNHKTMKPASDAPKKDTAAPDKIRTRTLYPLKWP